jgi:hypothetical protein
MYVSIKKELVGICNCFGVLPRFASERVKRRFLISNVSASNRRLVRGEHVCRELRVERVCLEIAQCVIQLHSWGAVHSGINILCLANRTMVGPRVYLDTLERNSAPAGKWTPINHSSSRGSRISRMNRGAFVPLNSMIFSTTVMQFLTQCFSPSLFVIVPFPA